MSTEPWYAPVTNILGYSLLYYYYLIYYLIFSFYDTPDPDDKSPYKSMKMRMWCNIILLKLWRGEASDFFAGDSTVGHTVLLYLTPGEKRGQLTRLWILCNLFHFAFFLLLLIYPLVLFVCVFVPAVMLNSGQGSSASFKALVQDPMATVESLFSVGLLNTVHNSTIVLYDYGFSWLHRGTRGAFIMKYCPDLNNLKDAYQISSKKVMSERCLKYNVPHPPALRIWNDYDWSSVENGFAVKSAWGAWHGEALWNGSELYFVDTLEEAQKVLDTTEPGRNEVIVQKRMFADEEFYQIWGGKPRLEGFRAYSCFVDGEYSILPLFQLVYTAEDGDDRLLLVRVDKKEIGFVEDGEVYSDEFQGKQFKWLDRIDEMKEVVIDAHKKLIPQLVLSAWDVAITTEGVMIIECGITGDLEKVDFDDPDFGKKMYDCLWEEFRVLRDARQSVKV